MKINKKIARIFYKTEELLKIKGTRYKPQAYHRAAQALEALDKDLSKIRNFTEISGVGKSIAQKIQEYLKTGKIKYFENLKQETAIRQIVTYFFESKGLNLGEIKRNAKKRNIIYSRYTKPAKQLLELSGSIQKAKKAINKVAEWANSRDLDYTIETVFKKWLELDRLKPKEIVKKPYFEDNLMIWSKTFKKWYVISPEGEWLEFAGEEKEIEWRVA